MEKRLCETNTFNPDPLRIGPLVVETPLLLAPMAGYTDHPMRLLARDGGAGMTYTEVVNAQAYVRGIRLTQFMLEHDPRERPLAAHFYGRDPDLMAETAAKIEADARFATFDINAGCPVRKIVAKGAGAALMKEPDRIRRIVQACKEAVRMPVTVKTRIGWLNESYTALDIARAAEDGGADALAVHARYADHRHSGPADWKQLAEIKSNLSIPVIGNGGIRGAADARRMMEETGVDAVMIGRRAVGAPWFFGEVLEDWRGEPVQEVSDEQVRSAVRRHLEMLAELKRRERRIRRRNLYSPEKGALMGFRGHLVKYLAGYRGVKDLLRNMGRFETLEGFMEAVDRLVFTGRTYEPSRVEPEVN